MSNNLLVAVGSKQELRKILGPVSERNINKVRSSLHPVDKDWLNSSPFVFVASSGNDGSCDVSPKGDPRGFTKIINDTTIVIPERPGNRRADSYMNILENPNVGLFFIIPGRGDALRINGNATILKDAPFFDDLVAFGHRPSLALKIDIKEIYFHCSKSFMRANFWNQESWTESTMPERAQIVHQLKTTNLTLEELKTHYGSKYKQGLY